GVIIYDKDNFFEKILDRLMQRLKELGAERVWMGKKWYWRLKKDYKFGEVITIE
ncbi:MAG: nucleotidyltransferase domain-containing protein, partial [Nitrososphaerota archaeon]